MDDKQALELLRERARQIEKEVGDNDHHIERISFALADGEEPGRALEQLQDYNNRQYGLMFDLGKTEARIEELENRLREQEDKAHEVSLGERFAEGQPVAQEDYLDWIRPSLESPDSAVVPEHEEHHPHVQGEDAMLKEMHREDKEPEDYLDWYRAGGPA